MATPGRHREEDLQVRPGSHSGEAAAATPPICPITGSTVHERLCEQDGYVWIRFPASGFVRLERMPAPATPADWAADYIAGYERKQRSKMRRSLARARYLKRHMKGTMLLDVGSNVGIFVEAAGSLGLEACGIEPDAILAGHARRRYHDRRFALSTLEAYQTLDRYAGIYCSEVIEHATDPAAFGAKLFDLLAPDGVLMLTTPDIGEYMRAGTVGRHLGAPDHKLYFSRDNIVAFLKALGFRAVRHKPALRRKGIRLLAFK